MDCITNRKKLELIREIGENGRLKSTLARETDLRRFRLIHAGEIGRLKLTLARETDLRRLRLIRAGGFRKPAAN